MDKAKIYKYKTLNNVVTRLRDSLKTSDIVLLYAFNRTGKTRLSMAFKDMGKKDPDGPNTLYFNAYTEDLFVWNNDLQKDKERYLKINETSNFFKGFKGLSLEEKIHSHLDRYAQIDFRIDYSNWKVIFSREIPNPKYNPKNPKNAEPETIVQENLKISRGEENIFIFSVFLAICELAIEGHEDYKWVKYIYVDDPISSLDENNAITVASDLANLIKHDIEVNKDKGSNKKFIISSHHSLFYNVMFNELRHEKSKSYFLHKAKDETYRLQSTDDTPFFHHIEQLCELNDVVKKYEQAEKDDKKVIQSNILKTYHFNILRAVFEKTSVFFGRDDFSYCLRDVEDKDLYSRAVNIMSHGRYSLFAPSGMMKENAELFVKIFKAFIDKYKFELPEIFFE